MTELLLSNVSVELGSKTVVSGVTLEVEKGEWVGLLGPNGAGKTTLLRAITGAVPASGEVLVAGMDLTGLPTRQRAALIASVAQRPYLPNDMSLERYVLLGRNPHITYLGVEGRHDLVAVAEAISVLELEGFEQRPLRTLSGGEAQRAVLARALAQQAPILLLDEPTAALDIGHQQSVLSLVQRLHRERALTVVAAMHDLTLAGQFCDRLVLMDEGRIVAEGRAEAVLTEEIIRLHYGAEVRVIADAEGVAVVPVKTSPTSIRLGVDR